MNTDDTNREWDGRQWAGETSESTDEHGHWNRREWVGDQSSGDVLTRDDPMPDDQSIRRDDRDDPTGPSGMGHNPEHAHWADTGGDR